MENREAFGKALSSLADRKRNFNESTRRLAEVPGPRSPTALYLRFGACGRPVRAGTADPIPVGGAGSQAGN